MTVDHDRLEHLRGPGRGDGHRRRSVAWLRLREDAETRPCTHRIGPAWGGHESRRCAAEAGETCRNPATGELLEHQPAHAVRMRPTTRPTSEETPR